MSVYSARFVYKILSNTSVNAYEVPAGKVIIVKEVTLLLPSGANVFAFVQWHDGTGDHALFGTECVAGKAQVIPCRWVFYAGEQLRPYALTTNVVRCMITGFIFDA